MDISQSLPQNDASTAQVDPMLRALAEVAERSPLELGVTLNVKGLIITGFIISQSTYFDSLINGLETVSQEHEVKESLQEFLSGLKKKLVPEKTGINLNRDKLRQ
jgi:hypothetical protein